MLVHFLVFIYFNFLLLQRGIVVCKVYLRTLSNVLKFTFDYIFFQGVLRYGLIFWIFFRKMKLFSHKLAYPITLDFQAVWFAYRQFKSFAKFWILNNSIQQSKLTCYFWKSLRSARYYVNDFINSCWKYRK